MNYYRTTPNPHVQASTQRERDVETGDIPTLHLVDIENLCGGTTFSSAEVKAVERSYRRTMLIGSRDQVVLASSRWAAPAAWFGWPNTRRLVRSGPDGADLALLEVIDTENVGQRFERVVIASGDHIFAQAAAMLQAAGVHVVVVSRVESLSLELRFAVRDVRRLDPESVPAQANAMRAA